MILNDINSLIEETETLYLDEGKLTRLMNMFTSTGRAMNRGEAYAAKHANRLAANATKSPVNPSLRSNNKDTGFDYLGNAFDLSKDKLNRANYLLRNSQLAHATIS
jgi:hypothetical protein